jgi:hypothetical protein
MMLLRCRKLFYASVSAARWRVDPERRRPNCDDCRQGHYRDSSGHGGAFFLIAAAMALARSALAPPWKKRLGICEM